MSSIFAGTESAYDRVSSTLMLCQMLAILEVVNVALGLVKGGVLPAFMQVLLSLLTIESLLICCHGLLHHLLSFA